MGLLFGCNVGIRLYNEMITRNKSIKCNLTSIVAGMALMNATSFLLELTLTPHAHSGRQPGGLRAHFRNEAE